MKNILLHPKHKKKIAKDIGVSKQTVDMSLSYVFNSFNAKKIRSLAKELLVEEARKINDDDIIN
jgi:FixJ family two-component response regulator